MLIILALFAIGAGHAVSTHPAVPGNAPPQEAQPQQRSANSATSASPTLGQPIPFPAPVEHSAVTQTLNIGSVENDIVGTWQSVDDPNYSITITSDGTWTDFYGTTTPAEETGSLTLFTSEDPSVGYQGSTTPGVVYLKVAEGKSTLYYSLTKLTEAHLQLLYLDRGNTLSFVKVN